MSASTKVIQASGAGGGPTGSYIATAHTGGPRFTLLDHTTPGSLSLAATYTTDATTSGFDAEFSPDGNYIAFSFNSSGVQDRFALLDHTTPGSVSLASSYQVGGAATSVSFSPDGDYIAVAVLTANNVTLLDHTTPGSVSLADTYALPGGGNAVSFSPDGNYVAVSHDSF